MENKLNIRVGDVVRLIPLTVTEVYDDGDMCFKEDVGLISPGLVESVIAHAETDAEKIARLEAELAKTPRRIEWSGGDCPVSLDQKVVVYLLSGLIDCGYAHLFTWGHHQDHDNMIAYMVLPS